MLKKFLINFVASVGAYFIVSFIGFLLWIGFVLGSGLLGWFVEFLAWIGIILESGWLVFDRIIILTVAVGSIVLISTGISVILFFFLGRKLNLLGESWLNCLSVGGGFIVAMILVATILGSFEIMAAIAPFKMLWIVADSYTIGTGSIVLTCIIATFPIIITWLGMLHKSQEA